MLSSATKLPPWSPATFFDVTAVWQRWGSVERSGAAHVPPRVVLATSVALSLLTIPAVERTSEGKLVASLRATSLNRRDAGQFQRGYYENLLDVGRFNQQRAQVYGAMPSDFVRSLSALG